MSQPQVSSGSPHRPCRRSARVSSQPNSASGPRVQPWCRWLRYSAVPKKSTHAPAGQASVAHGSASSRATQLVGRELVDDVHRRERRAAEHLERVADGEHAVVVVLRAEPPLERVVGHPLGRVGEEAGRRVLDRLQPRDPRVAVTELVRPAERGGDLDRVAHRARRDAARRAGPRTRAIAASPAAAMQRARTSRATAPRPGRRTRRARRAMHGACRGRVRGAGHAGRR